LQDSFYVFLAENLAHLPYALEEDPLSIIFKITEMLSTESESLLSTMKARCQSLIQQKGGSVVMETGREASDERASVSSKVICHTALALGRLVILKRFLQNRYRLTDEKCTSFSRATTKANEKETSPQNRAPLDWTPLKYIEEVCARLTQPADLSMEDIFHFFSWVKVCFVLFFFSFSCCTSFFQLFSISSSSSSSFLR